eukprot:216255_1
MSTFVGFLLSIYITSTTYAATSCPNGYSACVEVTNNCGSTLWLQRGGIDGDEAWPKDTAGSEGITAITTGSSTILDISAWGSMSGGKRIYAWWQNPLENTWDPMKYRDKVEINWESNSNTMYYNPTGVDNFGLPVYIGPYNSADCQSGATTGFGTIKISDVATGCQSSAYEFISTPPFGVCQSPRLVCYSNANNPICSELDNVINDCISNGNCASGTTTPMVWGCEGTMAQATKWCSAITRGVYYYIRDGGNEADTSQYFKTEPYNKYAAFLHQSNAQHYAFPYDDYPSTLNEGGYIQCNGLRYMKVQFCPADAGGSGTTSSTSSPGCGYIPTTCQGDLTWAVTDGSKNNPNYYPDFTLYTGATLDTCTQDDMVLYWVCKGKLLTKLFLCNILIYSISKIRKIRKIRKTFLMLLKVKIRMVIVLVYKNHVIENVQIHPQPPLLPLLPLLVQLPLQLQLQPQLEGIVAMFHQPVNQI